MTVGRRGFPRLRRWSAGQRVDSAARLNQPIDAIESLRDTLGNLQTGNVGQQASRHVIISNVAGPAIGQVLCKFATTDVNEFPVYLEPELYTQANYTYTDNNNRTFTPTDTDELLTPMLVLGLTLWATFTWHPVIQQVVWIDNNRTGRMWAEEPPTP